MHVKVIGCHCHKCKTLQHNVREVARRHGWKVTIEVITDPDTVHAYGDLPAPALLINDELVSTGVALHPRDIESLWVINHD